MKMKTKTVKKPVVGSKKPKVKKLKNLVKVEQSNKIQKENSDSENDTNNILKIKPKKKPIQKDKIKKRKDSDLLKHKKELEKLKDIDPEFYQFLKQNDKKLLEFNFDDSDDDFEDTETENMKNKKKGVESASEDDEDEDEEEERIHKPTEKLEVASDESDYEASDEDKTDEFGEAKTVTLKLLKTWQTNLQEKHPSIEIIRKVIQAFSSALSSLSGEVRKLAVYKVEGSATFNAIVQLCVLHLQPAISNFLGIAPKSKKPLHKSKKWKRIRSSLRTYLVDLIGLIEHVQSANILTVLLKHLHQMSNMIGSFTSISKTILKRLISLWSTSDETVRVLSFLCILKITRDQQISLLNHVLKAMYLSYVRNSKFVSPNTLPGINFMRRSLVEMFALDLNVAYQHVFLYIRQLAIHLRNAMILKKKDSFQAVYNWQFINSIRLWSDLLGATANKPQLQPLIYPLVSITTGVIKLIPTAQFFPLRFHCIQALINLQRKSNTFIPVLPFILEVLNSNTFNKKHTVVSMKPMQFTCILRLNKSQMAENGFRDEVIENVCGLLLEYLDHESASLAYPDLVVPTVCFLKKYLKECKNSNYSRKLKQLLDKILENSKFIEDERRKITFGLKDTQEIQAWETKIRNKGTPLSVYYSSWTKTHETKKRRQAANTDEINDYDIPFIKRKKADESTSEKKKNINKDGELELFPSDEEDDDIERHLMANYDDDNDNATNNSLKTVKKIKKVKKQKENDTQKEENKEQQHDQNYEFEDDDGVDIVKDLDIDDW